MLDIDAVDEAVLADAKRHLKITWTDDDTDGDVWARLCRCEAALNAKIGAEVDYLADQWAAGVLFDRLLYDWNGCADQFDEAYRNDVQQLRALYACEVPGEE